MKSISQYSFLLLIIFLFVNTLTFSQKISEVSFELVEDEILVYYTLIAPQGQEFEIKTLLKRLGDESFSYLPQNLSQDIGEGQYSGVKKTIVWKVTDEEMNLLDGDDFYFEITADKIIKSKGIPWYYYAGGAIVAGSVAAITLLGGDDKSDSPTTTVNFANPPDRP